MLTMATDIGSTEFTNCTVQIPKTPDNQPMRIIQTDPTTLQRIEQQYVSSSIFTGGFNTVARAHLLDKVIDSEARHPQMVGAKGSSCAVAGCDGKVMRDERGVDILPCECDFKICRDCYIDAIKSGGSMCPGCDEPYKNTELDQENPERSHSIGGPGMVFRGNLSMVRSTSILQSRNSMMIRSQTNDFDPQRCLFETKETNGYRNATRPKKEGQDGRDGDNDYEGPKKPTELSSRSERPITRKLKIPAAVLIPYRLLIFLRMIIYALFLVWWVRHRNQDAMWLWGMSVVCEIWLIFIWFLDYIRKLCPVIRSTDPNILKEKFETPNLNIPIGKSDLPGIDIFVSTADPEQESPLITATTILSILAADYPAEKLSCYVSDDGGALLTFEAIAEAASFANIWVPFCRKHRIEPRNPETYFILKKDPYKTKVSPDFVKDWGRVKREYDAFKVRINGLPEAILQRSDAYNANEEFNALKHPKRNVTTHDEPIELLKVPKATRMVDGTHWPGTWLTHSSEHSKGDHASIIQVMLKPPSDEPLVGHADDVGLVDVTEVDIRLPMLVYVSREKRPGYNHNKKAGAMNALVRASAIMSNGPFILNLDCDQYVYNSQAMREAMCFMMDRGGDRKCYVQFTQRFDGIDPSDRYDNKNTVFFDASMRALDGIQGPFYLGTGCLFRRIALYGFDPPRAQEHSPSFFDSCYPRQKRHSSLTAANNLEGNPSLRMDDEDEEMPFSQFPKKFGKSNYLVNSIPVAEFQGRPLADHPAVKNGRPPGALTVGGKILGASTVVEGVNVISCCHEDKTEWGERVGWIYGSLAEDIVTGYRMHCRGWRSVYCVTSPDAFRGTAPINLTDRLHQVLRWATGSIEIFLSRNNPLLAGHKMKFLQKIAYICVEIYPFSSIFTIVYCLLPALSLFSGQFVVQTIDATFLTYLLVMNLTHFMQIMLEIKWSGINLEEWWRNEQFSLISGTSSHFAALIQGFLKVVAGIEIPFKLTSKSARDDADGEFADLYVVKWTSLMIVPILIMMLNLIGIVVGFRRTIYSTSPEWSKLIGGVFFSFYVLVHFYPFAQGLIGRRGKNPTIVSGLFAITISVLWVAIKPSSSTT